MLVASGHKHRAQGLHMSAMCCCASCACQLLQARRCRCREFVELMAVTASTTRMAIACCKEDVWLLLAITVLLWVEIFAIRLARRNCVAIARTMDGMRSWGHPELPRSCSDPRCYDAELRNQHRRHLVCHVGLSGNGLRRRSTVAPAATQGAACTPASGISSQAPACRGHVSAEERLCVLGCACFTLQSARCNPARSLRSALLACSA